MSKKNTKEKNSPHKIDQGIFQKPSKKISTTRGKRRPTETIMINPSGSVIMSEQRCAKPKRKEKNDSIPYKNINKK